jgi:3-methyladenine DNA glycosylase AlkD
MQNIAKNIILELKRNSDPRARAGMARYGIRIESALGVSIPVLRKIAKTLGDNHKLALTLWKLNIHEARILAGMIDDPCCVTERQMDLWVKNFNSWDLCDQTCNNLFCYTKFAYKKALIWSKSTKEYIRRAGFVLMAVLAVHDKNLENDDFMVFLSLIKKHASDERNFVKKAVNWALRQIGKRNSSLNNVAIQTANEILMLNSKSAKWIASDAIRELTSSAVHKRLQAKIAASSASKKVFGVIGCSA